MKVETVEQYKVLEYIKENFDLKFIELNLINKSTILLHDKNSDSALFKFNEKSGKIEINYDFDYIKF